jgi:hypothetical protein
MKDRHRVSQVALAPRRNTGARVRAENEGSHKRECIKASDVTGMSHFMQTLNGSVEAIQKGGKP